MNLERRPGFCPIAGVPNGCRLDTGEAYKGPCWCDAVTLPQVALNRLLENELEPRCLCQSALEAIAAAPGATWEEVRVAALDRVAEDEKWMRHALDLARRALGQTAPNPAVGAVVVRDGVRLGEGFHERAGQPHAEPNAIRRAQALGHTVAGATIYISLEPCSTWGRTPPCTDLLLRERLARVVVGATDPHPQHRGRAYEILRRAGVSVTAGILADECAALNPEFNARFATAPSASEAGHFQPAP